jgi:hypothetical protein
MVKLFSRISDGISPPNRYMFECDWLAVASIGEMMMKKSARLIAAGGLAALGLGLLGASAFAHSPKQGMPAGAKAHHTEMRERLLSLDKNQDGMVSQSEINNGRSERFAVIDTDKDGKLSAGEIDESRKAKRLDRINRRLAAMDTDGGGAINHEDRWVLRCR